MNFKSALDAGVTIANGSDMGVFAHGDGATRSNYSSTMV